MCSSECNGPVQLEERKRKREVERESGMGMWRRRKSIM